ncbi:hypothetical protein [Blastococcus haudaquaticus]|nr:hypothetical protein [Blastococcus haudaquaticus]
MDEPKAPADRTTVSVGKLRMPIDKLKMIIGSSLIVSLLLYVVGIKFVLVATCVAAGVVLLPPVAVMRSLVGRLFLSVFVLMGVFQASATIQFFAFPSTGFAASAAITTVIYLVAALLTDRTTDDVRDLVTRFASRHDVPGAVVAAIFLVPFVPFLIGNDTVARVAQIGGGQAVDSTNHFANIAQMMSGQHWVYAVGNYYPKSFHIVTAFLQDALFVPQISMSWRGAVLVYIGQYLVFGVLLAGALGYFASAVFAAVAQRYPIARPGLLLSAVGLAVGAAAGPFLLWSFVHQGFLNYYYVMATILLAFTALMTGSKERLFSTLSLYLVLTFGAAMSWPLLIPVLLATPFVLMCQRSYLDLLRAMPKRHLLGVAVLVVVQFIPIGLQLRYGGSDNGVNALGGLTTFRPLSLLLGALIVFGLAVNKNIDRDSRDKSIALVLPLLTFIALLAVMQLFLTGEVRYYVIKTAFLLEAVNIVILSCVVAVVLSQMDLGAVGRFFAAAITPAVAIFALFAVGANPLSDLRNLFRTEANQVKPDFYDADLALYARLGEAGRVDGFNTTLLHYNPLNDTYGAHMQTARWANMMQYDGGREDGLALYCQVMQYSKFGFGSVNDSEDMQREMVQGIKDCAQVSKDLGREHIILTDPASEQRIRDEFGDVATIVTHETRIENDGE